MQHLNSLFMTVMSTFSCTVVAFLFAYTIVRLNVPLKGLFKFVTILPIVSPPFIVALSYILLFGRQGIITKNILHMNIDIYGWHGLWMVQTITFFPYAYTVIYGVLKSIPSNLEFAAYNLGASRWMVFKDIIFPLCRPGIAGGALMAAMNVLADFGNPIMIAGNFSVLPTEAYMAVIGNFDMPTAATLVTMLLVPAVCIFAVNRYWVGKRSYVTITGKEASLNQFKPPFYIKWGLFVLCIFITLFILSVYGVLFFGGFTELWGFNWSLTLKNFNYVFFQGTEIYNSLKFALIASFLASVLSVVVAYFVQRKQFGFNRFLDFLAILPSAIPGIFLGLGFVIAFNDGPLILTGTSAIMILALTFWNIPTCYTANLQHFSRSAVSIEEASLNLGCK